MVESEGKSRSSKDFAKWKVASVKIRSKLGISASYNGWTGENRPKGVKCWGVPPTERYHDILDCAWAARLKAKGDQGVEACRRGFFANPSQSIDRQPWSEGAAHT